MERSSVVELRSWQKSTNPALVSHSVKAVTSWEYRKCSESANKCIFDMPLLLPSLVLHDIPGSVSFIASMQGSALYA